MKLLGLVLIAAILFAGCIGGTQATPTVQATATPSATVVPTVEATEQPSVEATEQPEATEEPTETPSVQLKEFDVEAKQFVFNPGTITVEKGDLVRLHITSDGVNHGIAIPDFGVSQQLPAGERITVEFTADKAGEFTFFCNVFCGSGHKSMTGTLIVTE